MAAGLKTGGRQRGTPNKATADIRAIARKHGKEGVKALLDLARSAEVEGTRLAAWKELLDRGYGKPAQALEVAMAVAITSIERRIIDPVELVAETVVVKAIEHDDD